MVFTLSCYICILAEQGDTKCEIDGVYFIMLSCYICILAEQGDTKCEIDGVYLYLNWNKETQSVK